MMLFAFFVATGMSQQLKPKAIKTVSRQWKTFNKLVAEDHMVFVFPPGFKEVPAVHNENLSFDYAMELPEEDFEIWLRVRSQKQVWADYKYNSSDTTRLTENPDSLYNRIGPTLASEFTSDRNYFTTIIPRDVLARYHANAGKTYLLQLSDTPETKHYKYALLITLHKDHVGTLVAVCFGNDKGTEFFKNISKASKCLKFKP